MKLYVFALVALCIFAFTNVSLADSVTTYTFNTITVKGKPSPVVPDGVKSLKCEKKMLVQGTVGSTVKVCTWKTK